MKMAGNSVFCLTVLFCVIGLIECLGYVETNFKEFVNFEGKRFDGNCCDKSGFWSWGASKDKCTDECDHSFVICIGNATQSSSMSACEFGQQELDYVGGNKISFNSHVGTAVNPIKFQFESWPGVVKLKIDVHDKDGDNEFDFVDHYEYQYNTRDLRREIDAQQESLVLTGTRTRFNMDLKVYCGIHYYGKECNIFCTETDDDTGHYKCDPSTGEKICKSGWTGDDCLTNIDDCVGNRCSYGSTCVDGLNFYSCLCPPGRTGFTCEAEINECASAPCQNGGKCLDASNSFICECTPGFAGPLCEVEIDECRSGPCLNGGACIDRQAAFTCVCQNGFTGNRCEIDIDECSSNPCISAEKCVDLPGDYRCDCFHGFTGKNCEYNVNECISSPCQNGGGCIDDVSSFRCICQYGFTGSLCEARVNYCEPNYCQNNATCSSLETTSECHCTQQFTGTLCEIDVDECESDSQLCGDNGICLNTVGNYLCSCNEGFEGNLCEIETDECLATEVNCLNDGICIDLINDFRCDCTGTGFSGSICEEEIDECESSPCENGGTCIDMLNGFVCNCSSSVTGERCEMKTVTPSTVMNSTIFTTSSEASLIEIETTVTLLSEMPSVSSNDTYSTLGVTKSTYVSTSSATSSPDAFLSESSGTTVDTVAYTYSSPSYDLTVENDTDIQNITIMATTLSTETTNKTFTSKPRYEQHNVTKETTDTVELPIWNITVPEISYEIENITTKDKIISTETGIKVTSTLPTPIFNATTTRQTAEGFGSPVAESEDAMVSSGEKQANETLSEVLTEEESSSSGTVIEIVTSGEIFQTDEHVSSWETSGEANETEKYLSSGEAVEYVSSGEIIETEEYISSGEVIEYESSGEVVEPSSGEAAVSSVEVEKQVSSGDIIETEVYTSSSGDVLRVSSAEIIDTEEYTSSDEAAAFISSGEIIETEEYTSSGEVDGYVSSGEIIETEEYTSSGEVDGYVSSGEIIETEEYTSSGEAVLRVSSGEITEMEVSTSSGEADAYISSGETVETEEYTSSGEVVLRVPSGKIIEKEEYNIMSSGDAAAYISSGEIIVTTEYMSSGEGDGYVSSGEIIETEEYTSSGEVDGYVSSGEIFETEEYTSSGEAVLRVSSGEITEMEVSTSSGEADAYISSGETVETEEYTSSGEVVLRVPSGKIIEKEEYNIMSSGDAAAYISSGEIIVTTEYMSSGEGHGYVSSGEIIETEEYTSSGEAVLRVSSGEIIEKEEYNITSSGDAAAYISSGEIIVTTEYMSSGEGDGYVSSVKIIETEEYASSGEAVLRVSSGEIIDIEVSTSSGEADAYISSGETVKTEQYSSSGDGAAYISSGETFESEEYMSSGEATAYMSSGEIIETEQYASSGEAVAYISSGETTETKQYTSSGDGAAYVSSGDTIEIEQYVSSGETDPYASSGEIIDVSSGEIIETKEYASSGEAAAYSSSGEIIETEEYTSSGKAIAYISSGETIESEEYMSSGEATAYISSGETIETEHNVSSGDADAYISSGEIIETEHNVSSGEAVAYISSGEIIETEHNVSSGEADAYISSGETIETEHNVSSGEADAYISSGETIETEHNVSSGEADAYISSGEIIETEHNVSSGEADAYVSSGEIIEKEQFATSGEADAYVSSRETTETEEYTSSGDGAAYVSSVETIETEQYISSGQASAYISSAETAESEEYTSSDETAAHVSSGEVIDVSSGEIKETEEYASSGEGVDDVSSGDVTKTEKMISSGETSEYLSSGEISQAKEHTSSGEAASSGDIFETHEYISSGEGHKYISSGEMVEYVSSGEVIKTEDYMSSGEALSSGDIITAAEHISSGESSEHLLSSNTTNTSPSKKFETKGREGKETLPERVSSGDTLMVFDDILTHVNDSSAKQMDLNEDYEGSGEYFSSGYSVTSPDSLDLTQLGLFADATTEPNAKFMTKDSVTNGQSIHWTSSDGQITGDSDAKLINYTEYNIVSSGDGQFIDFIPEERVDLKHNTTTDYQTKPAEGVTRETQYIPDKQYTAQPASVSKVELLTEEPMASTFDKEEIMKKNESSITYSSTLSSFTTPYTATEIETGTTSHQTFKETLKNTTKSTMYPVTVHINLTSQSSELFENTTHPKSSIQDITGSTLPTGNGSFQTIQLSEQTEKIKLPHEITKQALVSDKMVTDTTTSIVIFTKRKDKLVVRPWLVARKHLHTPSTTTLRTTKIIKEQPMNPWLAARRYLGRKKSKPRRKVTKAPTSQKTTKAETLKLISSTTKTNITQATVNDKNTFVTLLTKDYETTSVRDKTVIINEVTEKSIKESASDKLQIPVITKGKSETSSNVAYTETPYVSQMTNLPIQEYTYHEQDVFKTTEQTHQGQNISELNESSSVHSPSTVMQKDVTTIEQSIEFIGKTDDQGTKRMDVTEVFSKSPSTFHFLTMESEIVPENQTIQKTTIGSPTSALVNVTLSSLTMKHNFSSMEDHIFTKNTTLASTSKPTSTGSPTSALMNVTLSSLTMKHNFSSMEDHIFTKNTTLASTSKPTSTGSPTSALINVTLSSLTMKHNFSSMEDHIFTKNTTLASTSKPTSTGSPTSALINVTLSSLTMKHNFSSMEDHIFTKNTTLASTSKPTSTGSPTSALINVTISSLTVNHSFSSIEDHILTLASTSKPDEKLTTVDFSHAKDMDATTSEFPLNITSSGTVLQHVSSNGDSSTAEDRLASKDVITYETKHTSTSGQLISRITDQVLEDIDTNSTDQVSLKAVETSTLFTPIKDKFTTITTKSFDVAESRNETIYVEASISDKGVPSNATKPSQNMTDTDISTIALSYSNYTTEKIASTTHYDVLNQTEGLGKHYTLAEKTENTTTYGGVEPQAYTTKSKIEIVKKLSTSIPCFIIEKCGPLPTIPMLPDSFEAMTTATRPTDELTTKCKAGNCKNETTVQSSSTQSTNSTHKTKPSSWSSVLPINPVITTKEPVLNRTNLTVSANSSLIIVQTPMYKNDSKVGISSASSLVREEKSMSPAFISSHSPTLEPTTAAYEKDSSSIEIEIISDSETKITPSLLPRSTGSATITHQSEVSSPSSEVAVKETSMKLENIAQDNASSIAKEMTQEMTGVVKEMTAGYNTSTLTADITQTTPAEGVSQGPVIPFKTKDFSLETLIETTEMFQTTAKTIETEVIDMFKLSAQSTSNSNNTLDDKNISSTSAADVLLSEQTTLHEDERDTIQATTSGDDGALSATSGVRFTSLASYSTSTDIESTTSEPAINVTYSAVNKNTVMPIEEKTFEISSSAIPGSKAKITDKSGETVKQGFKITMPTLLTRSSTKRKSEYMENVSMESLTSSHIPSGKSETVIKEGQTDVKVGEKLNKEANTATTGTPFTQSVFTLTTKALQLPSSSRSIDKESKNDMDKSSVKYESTEAFVSKKDISATDSVIKTGTEDTIASKTINEVMLSMKKHFASTKQVSEAKMEFSVTRGIPSTVMLESSSMSTPKVKEHLTGSSRNKNRTPFSSTTPFYKTTQLFSTEVGDKRPETTRLSSLTSAKTTIDKASDANRTTEFTIESETTTISMKSDPKTFPKEILTVVADSATPVETDFKDFSTQDYDELTSKSEKESTTAAIGVQNKEYSTSLTKLERETKQDETFYQTTISSSVSLPFVPRTSSETQPSSELTEKDEYMFEIEQIEEIFPEEELTWLDLLKTVIETTTTTVTTAFSDKITQVKQKVFPGQEVPNVTARFNKTNRPMTKSYTSEQQHERLKELTSDFEKVPVYTTPKLIDLKFKETPEEISVDTTETTLIQQKTKTISDMDAITMVPIPSSPSILTSTEIKAVKPYIRHATILTYVSKGDNTSENEIYAQRTTEATVASSVPPTTQQLSKVRHEVDLTAKNQFPNPRKETFEYIRNTNVTKGKAKLTFQKIKVTVIRGYQEGKRIVLQTYQKVKNIGTTIVVTTYRRARELLEEALQRVEALWQYCKTGIDHYIVKPLLNARVYVKNKFEQTYARLSEIFKRGKDILKMTTDNVRQEASSYFDSLTKYYTDVYRQYSMEVRDIFESLKIPDS